MPDPLEAPAARFGLLLGLILLGALALIVGAILMLSPQGPALLPPRATPLALRTQPWKPWPIGGFGCPMAGVAPLRVEVDGSSMVFERADGAHLVSIVWPYGFSARLLDGKAELVAPDGTVLATQDQVISNLAGSSADNGDIVICFDMASRPLVEGTP